MLCACRPVGINSYLKAERISMSKSIQVACECWEREIRSLQAISFTNQVVFSLRPEKDAYGVRAILPRPEGRGLSRFLVNLLHSLVQLVAGDIAIVRVDRFETMR